MMKHLLQYGVNLKEHTLELINLKLIPYPNEFKICSLGSVVFLSDALMCVCVI